MVERIESQQTNSKDRTLRKGLDIGKDIVKQRNMTKKEKKDDSPRNNDDSLKELYERQKNEIIRRKLDTKEIERDSVVKEVNNGRKNNYSNLKEKANSDSVLKVEVKDKKCNSLKKFVVFYFFMLPNTEEKKKKYRHTRFFIKTNLARTLF